MVEREGIGASLASAAVFSTLLISSLAVLGAADQHASLSARANAERRIYDEAVVMGGVIGLTLLDRLQNVLSSNVFPCTDAQQRVEAEYVGQSVSLSSDDLSMSGSLSAGLDSWSMDNMTIVKPFNGWRYSALNVVLELSGSSNPSHSGVRFEELESHRLNIMTDLGGLASFCLDSVQRVKSGIAGVNATDCDGEVETIMGRLAFELAQDALTHGWNALLTYSITPFPGCLVDFVSHVSQPDVQGPLGSFSVRVEQGGSVPLLSQNSTVSS